MMDWEESEDLWLESLFREHGRAALLRARALVGDAEAEEIVQETFFDAWLKQDRRSEIGAGWIMRSITYRALNLRRRRPTFPLRDAELIAAQMESHDERLDLLEVLTTLTQMNENDRDLLIMAAAGYSYAEIAPTIGRSPDATRMAIRRARLRLRALYDERVR